MIRINKNLLLFTGLIVFIGTSVLLSLQRFLPLLSHVTYYCQSVMNSLSMPIPYYLGLIPFLGFSLLFVIAMIKLLIMYTKVQLLKRRLLKNNTSHSNFDRLTQKLKLHNKAYLIEDKKQFAFCLGIFKPRIYISTGLVNLLTKRELKAVLLHERYHLANRDALTMLIAYTGESLLPFFPLISDLLRNFRVEREIRADAEAIQHIGNARPIISVLKKLLSSPSIQIATAAAIADQDTLEPRIRAIVKRDLHFRRFSVKHFFVSIVSLIVMSIITLAPVHAVEMHTMNDDVVMICPHDDTCLNTCKQAYSQKKNYSKSILYTPITK